MKRTPTLLFTLLLVIGGLAAQAQTKLAPRKPVQPRARVVVKEGNSVRDGVTMKEGKLLITQGGMTNTVLQETSLVNGTKIKPDGTVTMTNGTSATMKEGDYMSLTGRMTTAVMKAQQDSIAQANKAAAKTKKKKKGLF